MPCPLARPLCIHEAASVPALAREYPKPLPLNTTLEYIRELLQEALMVEHATVPLYLTSLFSIINGSEYAAATIHSVVIEEMLHMTIAANVLNAVGGAPLIDAPNFVPVYPMQLPMTNVSVDIRRFNPQSIANFMLIESTTAMVVTRISSETVPGGAALG